MLTKNDLAGRGFGGIVREIRREPVDVFLLADRAEEIERRELLYRILLSLGRARRRFLLPGRGKAFPVSPVPSLLTGFGHIVAEAFTGVAALLALLFRVAALPSRVKLARGAGGSHPESAPGANLAAPGANPAAPGANPSPPERIAFLRTDFWFGAKAGGSVSHISGFAEGARRAGHTMRFYSSDWLPDLDPAHFPVTVIPPLARYRLFEELAMAAYNAHFVREAEKKLRADPPTLLYHRHSVLSVQGILLRAVLRTPLLLEVNSSEVWVKRHWSRLVLAWPAEFLERAALRHADAITVVSKILKDQLVGMHVPEAKILVTPNAVDPDRFHPGIDGSAVRARLGLADKILLAFTGTFTRWHGVLFLAETAPRLAALDARVAFLFVGDGDLRRAAEQAIERAGLTNRAVFTGLVPHDEVPAHLAAADVCLSPHLPFESGDAFFGSPTKLFEYLAMGKAIVASRLGQIGDVIREGENGLLFEPGNEDALVAAVGRVVADERLRAKLGREARESAVRDHTWEANARKAIAFARARADVRARAGAAARG